MKADPPVRADGCCAVCRKPRKMPKPQKGVERSEYLRDPFCSSVCAREYHGVQIAERAPRKVAA